MDNNTYLDPDAMVRRINKMKEEAEAVYKEISKANFIMEDLKKDFTGESAARLQKKYNDLANTYDELLRFLNEKATMMAGLTTNIKNADEQ